MPLFQPSNIIPSTFAGVGGGTVAVEDLANISWQVNGNVPMTGYSIAITDKFGKSIYSTGLISIPPFYPTNSNGEQNFYTFASNSTWGDFGLENGATYCITITQYWTERLSNDKSVVQQSKSVFTTRTKPTLSIKDFLGGDISVIKVVRQEFIGVYSQAQNDTIDWVRWELYTINEIGDIIKKIIDTGITHTQSLNFVADNLINGNYYKVVCTVQTQSGVQVTASTDFLVSYEQETIDSISIDFDDTERLSNKLSWGNISQVSGISIPVSSATNVTVIEETAGVGKLKIFEDGHARWTMKEPGGALAIASPNTIVYKSTIDMQCFLRDSKDLVLGNVRLDEIAVSQSESNILFYRKSNIPRVALYNRNNDGIFEFVANKSLNSGFTILDAMFVGEKSHILVKKGNTGVVVQSYNSTNSDFEDVSWNNIISMDSRAFAFNSNRNLLAIVQNEVAKVTYIDLYKATISNENIESPILEKTLYLPNEIYKLTPAIKFSKDGNFICACGTDYIAVWQFYNNDWVLLGYNEVDSYWLNNNKNLRFGVYNSKKVVTAGRVLVTITPKSASTQGEIGISVMDSLALIQCDDNETLYEYIYSGTTDGTGVVNAYQFNKLKSTVNLPHAGLTEGAFFVGNTCLLNLVYSGSKSYLNYFSTDNAQYNFMMAGNFNIDVSNFKETTLYVTNKIFSNGFFSPLSYSIIPSTVPIWVRINDNGITAEINSVSNVGFNGLGTPNISVVELKGGQICDYVYIASGTRELTDETIQASGWISGTTEFFTNFNSFSLNAGQLTMIYPKMSIYREDEETGELHRLYEANESINAIRDYSWITGVSYKYKGYLSAYNKQVGIVDFNITPACKNQQGYVLLVTEQDEEQPDVYHVVTSLRFNNNVSHSDISNNNSPNFLTNFTGYRTKQPTSRKGRNGTLNALLSNTKSGVYVDTVAQMENLYKLSECINPMFLKDTKGNLYMVTISAPITQSINTTSNVKEVKVSIPWEEIGNVDNISIIQTTQDESWIDDSNLDEFELYVDEETGLLHLSKPEKKNATTFSLRKSRLGYSTNENISQPNLVLSNGKVMLAKE